MAYCDFVIKYNPDKDKPEDLTRKIFYSIFVKRAKAHKPTICFVGGDSGEGKSFSVLRQEEILLEMQGLNIKDYIEDINIFTPIEYPKKIDNILFDKRLKKINILAIHEAREVVKAKLWYTFLNQAIGDINAMSRSIKRLCIFIISQFIRDIAIDIRYTLNYYMIVRRPKNKKARVYISVLWKDDRDLEKPKLRKRKLSGYLVYPSGRYRRFIPQYLELTKPSKEIIEIFEKRDFESKAIIIRKKLNRLIKEMSIEMELENSKVEAMINFYSKNPDNLALIGKRRGNKWVINPEAKLAHDLTEEEVREFQLRLNKKLKDKNIIENKEEELTEDNIEAE